MPPKTQETGKLDEDVAIATQGVEPIPENHPDRAARLGSASQHLLKQFEREGKLESIKLARSFANDAVKATCGGIAETELLYNRSHIAWIEYQETKQPQRLDEAITDADKALTMVSNNVPREYDSDVERVSPEFIRILVAHSSTVLFKRYKLSQNLEDLEQAIGLARRVVNDIAEGGPAKAARLSNLSEMLFYRHKRTNEANDLSNAICEAKSSLSLTERSDTKRPSRLSILGVMLLSEFYLTGQMETLESGFQYSREAFDSISKDDPTYVDIRNNLVIMLASRHACTGDREHVDEVISLVREAVVQKNSAAFLSNLGTTFISRYESTEDITYLDYAITFMDEAIASTPDNHRDLPARLRNLSNALIKKYRRTKIEEYVKRAVFNAQKAVEKTWEGSHPMKLYEGTGPWNNQEEAIATGMEPAALTTAGLPGLINKEADVATEQKPEQLATPIYYPGIASRLSLLSCELFKKYMQNGSVQDLVYAISLLREGLKFLPQSHADCATMLNDLGFMLLARYKRLRSYKDLDDAVDAAGESIRTSDEHHPDKPGRITNMSHILIARYLAKDKQEREDLEQAICFAKDAFHALPVDNLMDRTVMQRYIREMVWERCQLKDPESDTYLDEAIQYWSEAFEAEKRGTPMVHDLPDKLSWLGIMFLERHGRTDADQDLYEASKKYFFPLSFINQTHLLLFNCLPGIWFLRHTYSNYMRYMKRRSLTRVIIVRHTREAIEILGPDYRIPLHPYPLPRVNSFSGSSLTLRFLVLWQGSSIGGRDGSDLRGNCFYNLSKMLFLRYNKGHNKYELNEAIDLAREGWRATPRYYSAELRSRLEYHKKLLMERYRLTNQEEDQYEEDEYECGEIEERLYELFGSDTDDMDDMDDTDDTDDTDD